MLRKYFYTKMLDLYLCYRGAQYSAAEAYSDDNEELVEFYNHQAREIYVQILTVKKVAADLIGKKNAVDLKHETRKDAQMLYENKVYWIPTESAEVVKYAERYVDNENVTEIFKKVIV